MNHNVVRIGLVILLAFIALTSIPSGVAMITGALHIPPEFLQGSLFRNYTIPGLVLAIIVGGSSLLAAVTVFVRREWSIIISMVAGIMMASYEVVELAIIQQFSWLQVLYFAIGAVILGLAGYLWMTEYRRYQFPTSHASHV